MKWYRHPISPAVFSVAVAAAAYGSSVRPLVLAFAFGVSGFCIGCAYAAHVYNSIEDRP